MVVGVHFYRDQISRVAQNQPGKNALVFCTASLVPEHDNPHDANAVLVQIGSEGVGHLSKEMALQFRARLKALRIGEQPTFCQAVISAGIETQERTYDYIIEVDLDLSTEPAQGDPALTSIERLDPDGIVECEANNTYLVQVWLGEAALNDMHKRRTIQSWTTDHWDAINYYVRNRRAIGLGYKLFSIPKPLHAKLFGAVEPAASFRSIVGRKAVVELVSRA